MLAPGRFRLEREQDLGRLERVVQLLLEELEVVVGVLFDDQSTQFAELRFQQGVADVGVALNRGLVQLEELLEGVVASLLQPVEIILVDELAFVELERRLHRRYLVLVRHHLL